MPKYSDWIKGAHSAYQVGKAVYNGVTTAKNAYTKYKSRKPKPTAKPKRRVTYRRASTKDSTIAPNKNYVFGRRPRINTNFIKKVRAAVSNKDVYNNIYSVSASASIGTCVYTQVGTVYDPNDYNAMSQVINAGASTSTTKFEINSATLTSQISNCSTNSSYLRVYLCAARNDIPYISGLTNTTSILTDGFTESGGNSSDVSQTAFQSSAFVQHFKIIKVQDIQFRPGEVRKFTIRRNKARLVNMARTFNSSNTRILLMEKGSMFFLFQQWGDVINDSITKTNVNLDATKFDFVSYRRYDFSWSQNWKTVVTSTSSLPTITTAEEVNDLTGATQTTTQA
jgi:hypothetical protein